MRPGEGGTGAPAREPVAANGPAGVLGPGSLYSIATAVQLGSGLLTIPILTRILDPTEYGVVTAGLVIQAVLVNIACFGLPVAVTRTWFRGAGPPAGRALIGLTAAGALAVGVLAYLTGPLWSAVFVGVDWGTVLKLAVVSAVPAATLLSAQVALQATASVRAWLVSAAFATAGAQLLGLALAAAAGGAGAYMAGITIGYALATGFAWSAAGFDLRALRPSAGGRALVCGALAVALPTIPQGLSMYLLSAADRIIVERIEGLPAAGAYYVAYAIGSLAIFLVAGLNRAWQPAIFGAEERGRWSFVAGSAVEILRVVAVAAAALAIGAPVALAVFAPGDYDVSGLGTVSALVAVSALPYLAYTAIANLIIWRGRTAVLAIVTPLCVVLNIVLCVVLIPPLGLDGAALATVLAYLALGLLLYWSSRSIDQVPWDAGRLAAVALPALAGLALALALPDDGAWLALRGALGTALALVALTLLTAERRRARAAARATA